MLLKFKKLPYEIRKWIPGGLAVEHLPLAQGMILVWGLSPPSGSSQGACFSLCLCLCISLCVSHEYIKSFKKKIPGGTWMAQQLSLLLPLPVCLSLCVSLMNKYNL